MKQVSIKIKNLQRENKALQEKIQELHQKTNYNFDQCKLQTDDICDPCLCRDSKGVLKNIIAIVKIHKLNAIVYNKSNLVSRSKGYMRFTRTF